MLTPPSTPKQIRVRKGFESPPPAPRPSNILKALSSKNVEKLVALLEDDPLLVVKSVKGSGRVETPLDFALRSRCPVGIIKLLLDEDPTPSEAALHGLIFLATRSKDSSQEIPLFPMLGDSSFSGPPLMAFGAGYLPLMSPPIFGQVQVPFTKDFNAGLESWHAMEIEEDGWEISVATCLLQHGADPFQKDTHGLCAVDHATQARKSALVDLMQNWEEIGAIEAALLASSRALG